MSKRPNKKTKRKERQLQRAMKGNLYMVDARLKSTLGIMRRRGLK